MSNLSPSSVLPSSVNAKAKEVASAAQTAAVDVKNAVAEKASVIQTGASDLVGSIQKELNAAELAATTQVETHKAAVASGIETQKSAVAEKVSNIQESVKSQVADVVSNVEAQKAALNEKAPAIQEKVITVLPASTPETPIVERLEAAAAGVAAFAVAKKDEVVAAVSPETTEVQEAPKAGISEHVGAISAELHSKANGLLASAETQKSAVLEKVDVLISDAKTQTSAMTEKASLMMTGIQSKISNVQTRFSTILRKKAQPAENAVAEGKSAITDIVDQTKVETGLVAQSPTLVNLDEIKETKIQKKKSIFQKLKTYLAAKDTNSKATAPIVTVPEVVA